MLPRRRRRLAAALAAGAALNALLLTNTRVWPRAWAGDAALLQGQPLPLEASAAAAAAAHEAAGGAPPHPPQPARGDECGAALALPTVALLFLTKGDLPHAGTWEAWFDAAAGLVPLTALGRTSCSEELVRRCAAAGGRQHLFTTHIHAPPGYRPPAGAPGWVRASLLPRASRVDAAWGSFGLARATLALLAAAFEDARNQRFVLASEACVPLLDPLTFYVQLAVAERASRVNACARGGAMPGRWAPEMAPAVPLAAWRKSGQFFGLVRAHARLVLADAAAPAPRSVWRAFEAHCNGSSGDGARFCPPDEHWIPSLLAAAGREAECACGSWGVAALDWSRGGAHPRSFAPAEVTPALFAALRGDARAPAAQAAAAAQFVGAAALAAAAARGGGACAALARRPPPPAYAPLLAESSFLLARKFPPATAPAVRALADDCELALLRGPHAQCSA